MFRLKKDCVGSNRVRTRLGESILGLNKVATLLRESLLSTKSLDIHVVVFSIHISILLEYFFELFYLIPISLYLVALDAI